MSMITWYQQRLNFQNADFSRIDHDDAMVAVVYKITRAAESPLILKICPRTEDYLRECYFLELLAESLPVPRLIQAIPPESDIHGAILMEYLPGSLLNPTSLTEPLAYEIGAQLARLHLNRVTGYGDLTHPHHLTFNPRTHFIAKFEEGFKECSNHLPVSLLQKAHEYFDTYLPLLDHADGPCIIHRDFRPGNLIVHEGKLQGIIDWSSARASFAEDDFFSLERGEWESSCSTKESFLKGYSSIRAVPNYTDIMPFLRLNRAFATIGFLLKQGTWDNRHAALYQFYRQFLEKLL